MIEIKKKSECCGCEACAQKCPKNCIRLVEDKEGYRYPIVNKATCVDCGVCEKVCPIINENEQQKPIEVLAAKNRDEHQRLAGSSGGDFSKSEEVLLIKVVSYLVHVLIVIGM